MLELDIKNYQVLKSVGYEELIYLLTFMSEKANLLTKLYKLKGMYEKIDDIKSMLLIPFYQSIDELTFYVEYNNLFDSLDVYIDDNTNDFFKYIGFYDESVYVDELYDAQRKNLFTGFDDARINLHELFLYR